MIPYKISILALLQIVLSPLPIHAAPLSGTKPNIILVLTDDQGMGDLSCMGNTYLKTPHLDQFYNKSTRFTDFQVSPTCAPTRSALMSGRHPFEVGVSHTVGQRERLAQGVVTFPQMLQKAGYVTGLFGKWHLGDEDAYLPQNRGFNEVLMHGAGGITQSRWGDFIPNAETKYFDSILLHNQTVVQSKGFCTDVFFDAGLAWSKKQIDSNQPFFTYISLNAPHGPMYAPEKYKKRFLDAGFDDKAAARYAMIENVDSNFGKLMQRLSEWNALENTLVIFMTDNGMSMPAFKVNGKQQLAFNAGMKGAKNSPHEGGTHVPSFWYWKGKTIEGADITALTAHLDIYRTFCDLAGVKAPEGKLPPRGRSLVPLLEDPKAEWQDSKRFVHQGRWNDVWTKRTREESKYQGCAVRTQRWRLVNNAKLYDISQDPGQKKDIAEQYPAVVKELRQAYDQWWDTLTPLLVNEDLEWTEEGKHPFQLRHKALGDKKLPLFRP